MSEKSVSTEDVFPDVRAPKPPPSATEKAALQTAVELLNTKKRLGLSLTIFDRNLNKIEGKFENMAELMRNPEFISRLSQELYVSDNEGSIWFKLKLRKGKFLSASFIMNFKLKWIKVYNKSSSGFDFLVVCYLPGFNVPAATAAIPQSAYTPERILNCFPLRKV